MEPERKKGLSFLLRPRPPPPFTPLLRMTAREREREREKEALQRRERRAQQSRHKERREKSRVEREREKREDGKRRRKTDSLSSLLLACLPPFVSGEHSLHSSIQLQGSWDQRKDERSRKEGRKEGRRHHNRFLSVLRPSILLTVHSIPLYGGPFHFLQALLRPSRQYIERSSHGGCCMWLSSPPPFFLPSTLVRIIPSFGNGTLHSLLYCITRRRPLFGLCTKRYYDAAAMYCTYV